MQVAQSARRNTHEDTQRNAFVRLPLRDSLLPPAPKGERKNSQKKVPFRGFRGIVQQNHAWFQTYIPALSSNLPAR